ncbi:MAG: hypothetical protein KJ077_19620 [Anaerolineae bacterium]|nr:hypothetical protein [Anaerolineae bacterium]
MPQMKPFIEANGPYGVQLLARRAYRCGDPICQVRNFRLLEKATPQTIQVGPQVHIETDALACLNHACQPSVIIDTAALAVFAARDLAPGEALTFFYPSTEWELDRPFICRCGSPRCLRFIAGAKYLSLDMLARYFINPHIRELALTALTQVKKLGSANRISRPAGFER